jgi:hypothetical protein
LNTTVDFKPNTTADFKLHARPKHPLFGAEARARRASVHIRSLRRHVRRWAEAHGDEINIQVNDAGEIIDGNLPDPELLGRAGIWIGEAVYNLRSSLDYLVYNIASVCNGMRDVPQTQFLICDEPDEFWDQVPRRLAHRCAYDYYDHRTAAITEAPYRSAPASCGRARETVETVPVCLRKRGAETITRSTPAAIFATPSSAISPLGRCYKSSTRTAS